MLVVDAALVNLTERFCHAFQRLTGRTNVWLAFQLTNLSIVIYFVSAGLWVWGSYGMARIVLAVLTGILLWAVSQTILRVPIETHENNAYSRVAKGLRNPRRVRDALLRIPFLTLSLLIPVFTLSLVLTYPAEFPYGMRGIPLVLLGYSLVVLTTVVLYLLACDPLPPQRGLLVRWLAPSPRRTEALAEE